MIFVIKIESKTRGALKKTCEPIAPNMLLATCVLMPKAPLVCQHPDGYLSIITRNKLLYS